MANCFRKRSQQSILKFMGEASGSPPEKTTHRNTQPGNHDSGNENSVASGTNSETPVQVGCHI